jgi:hypothetical protein
MLAKKSQASTERMEQLTDSIHVIAKKSERETVSTKVITLVTLFFLPGTFISVSFLVVILNHQLQSNQSLTMKLYNIKTIMSTPMVEFSSDTKNFQVKALQLYLAITIPFMALTFGAWGGLYMLAKRSDARKHGPQQKQKGMDSWISVV